MEKAQPAPLELTLLECVDLDVISRLRFSDDFRVYYAGDTRLITAMLNWVASSPGGRVVVSLSEGEVVGFLALIRPLAGDRFHGLDHVLELAADEVVPHFREPVVFEAMFRSALGDDVERWILYDVADPAYRHEGESSRAFRRREVKELRVLGFFPHPTDYDQAHLSRDSTFLVRVGARVPAEEVAKFFDRLHRAGERIRVAIALSRRHLRTLVTTDLDRHGFDVVSVVAHPVHRSDVDVVVTDFPEASGPFTVRVTQRDELHSDDHALWLPATDLARLPELIRLRRGAWQRSSANAS